MTPVVGTAALATVLVACSVALAAWVRAARSGTGQRGARHATVAALLAAAVAFGALEWALVTHDFSVRFVADNGGRSVPLYYRVTSLWAALEGSLLLWLLVLAGWGAALAVATRRSTGALHSWALAATCAVTLAFAALSLLAANPFVSVSPVPADGPGPNPLLQDHPAMGLHPPLLYLGFVGLVVPFSYAVAALVTGDTGRSWLQAARTWTLVAWSFLTAGIVLGAWWSYAVLGWGGYWAWDPVENASLLPWLTATALLHSALVQQRRQALRLWNLVLATASFLLVLLGTFLTRSGAVTSVHAFSESPLGPVLLGIFLAALVAVVALLVWRADRLGPDERVGSLLSREAALLGNNVVLAALACAVLLGTLYPLASEALSGQKVSVGTPYFDRMAVPAALLLLLLMAVGPLVHWDRDAPARVAERLAGPVVVGGLVVVVVGLTGARDPRELLAYGLAGAVVASSALRWGPLRRRPFWRPRLIGGALAHVGLAVAVVAIAASGSGERTAQQDLAVGERLAVGDVGVSLSRVERSSSEDRMQARAVLVVTRDGARVSEARPQLTLFLARGMAVSSPAVLSRAQDDVYVTVLAVAQDGSSATVRVAVHPLMTWLWVAGAMVAAGGLLAALPAHRRSRTGPEDPGRAVVPAPDHHLEPAPAEQVRT